MDTLAFTRGANHFEIVPLREAGFEGRLNGTPLVRNADRSIVARRLLQGTRSTEVRSPRLTR